jgi:hypothetical protein
MVMVVVMVVLSLEHCTVGSIDTPQISYKLLYKFILV